MMATDYEPQTETTMRRRARETGLRVWNNRHVDDLTDAEIAQALRYIEREAGIYYI